MKTKPILSGNNLHSLAVCDLHLLVKAHFEQHPKHGEDGLKSLESQQSPAKMIRNSRCFANLQLLALYCAKAAVDCDSDSDCHYQLDRRVVKNEARRLKLIGMAIGFTSIRRSPTPVLLCFA